MPEPTDIPRAADRLGDDLRALVDSGIRPVTFDEVAATAPTGRHRSPGWRPLVRVAVSVAVVALIAVPVALAVRSTPGTVHTSRTTVPTPVPGPKPGGPDVQKVLQALSATIDSGSFTVSYALTPATTPGVAPTTTTTRPPCQGVSLTQSCSGLVGGSNPLGSTVTGTATVDTAPFAMRADSNVSNFGQVTLWVDDTSVWESTDSGTGNPLSDFAGLVEGTLGQRQGALAMLALASPTGYLTLDQNAVTGATPVSTGVVDGSPVTVYRVTLDPAQQGTIPGTSPEEAKAITAALALLATQGYTASSVDVSIDAAGYIRQTVSAANFADGTSMQMDSTFSAFGCSGTVSIPGLQAAANPPSPCTSPDTAPTGASVPTTTPSVPTTVPIPTTTVPPTG